MGELFKTLTSGIARFVYAWIIPSVVTSGVFVILVAPSVGTRYGFIAGGLVFSIAVLTLSIVFAYVSRPMYQFLEGYLMPPWLARPLRRRAQRHYLRLQAVAMRGTPQQKEEAFEQLFAYPEELSLVMPTRLGNALKAMEGYGASRFGLDSQTFWYELIAVSKDKVRESTEETRAAVDFFISSIAHLLVLSIGSIAVVISGRSESIVTGLSVATVAALLMPLAYRQAVYNVGEWRYSVQALINTSRAPLAEAMTMQIPKRFEDEKAMWDALSGLVHNGLLDTYLDVLYWNRHPSFVDRFPSSGAAPVVPERSASSTGERPETA